MLLADWQILEYVERAGKPVPVDTLRAYIGDGADARISAMCRAGMLRRNGGWFAGKALFSLGPAGYTALSAHNEQVKKLSQDVARQDAADKRQLALYKAGERANWRRFWLGLFIGWILGVISPIDVWGWISILFK